MHTMAFIRRNPDIMLFIAFLCLGLWLRLYHFPQHYAVDYGDVARDYLVAHHIVAFGERPMLGPNNSFLGGNWNSPVYYYVLASLLLIKDSMYTPAFVNIVLQIASIIALYGTARIIFGPTTAFLSGVLLLFSQRSFSHVDFFWQPWVALGVSAIVSSLLSDSVGFSLSWMVRLATGYLVYQLFLTIATRETIRVFVNGALLFAVSAAALSVGLRLFPSLGTLLPSMNLTDVRFGHNHLADLLVFVLPAALSLVFFFHPPVVYRFLFAFGYIFLLLSTYARGAWLVVAAIGAAYVFLYSGQKRNRVASLIVAGVLVGIIGFSTVGLHRIIRPLTIQSRLEYWRQAIESIKERPIFGSGPGTFSLTSQRLQQRPGQSSWFAHSFLLEITSETGVVGGVIFMWLITAHIRMLVKRKILFQKKSHAKTLLWSLTAIAIYGLYEFVLNYHVLWLLFWAGAGLLTGSALDDHPRVLVKHPAVLLPIFFILVFYTTWIFSALVATAVKRHDIAFYIAPFDAGNAQVALTMYNEDLGPLPNTSVLLYFHKKNPAVLKELAAYYTKNGRDQEAGSTLFHVIQLNPKNLEGYALYDDARKRIVQPLDFVDQTSVLAKGFLSNDASADLDALLSRYNAHDADLALPRIDIRKLSEYTTQESLARAIYLIGFGFVDTDKEAALSFWELSSDIDPNLSFYAVEQANLLAQQGNLYEALTVLDQCQINRFARRHCAEFRQQITSAIYLPVGYFSEYMKQSLPLVPTAYEE